MNQFINRVMAGLLVMMSVLSGYFFSDLMTENKKVEFVDDSSLRYDRLECQMTEQECQVDGYHLTLMKGHFTPLEKTTFQLNYQHHALESEVLVSSDDHLFGTIKSQPMSGTPGAKQVMLPYCGNSDMSIILVDTQRGHALVVSGY
jgi:hypothetical protein